jgi:hypothetical protein
MNFHFTEIPVAYPFPGLLDFRAPTIQALFNYAVACAAGGYLWTGVDREFNSSAGSSSQSRPAADGAFAQCPTGRPAKGDKDLRKTARSPR